MAQNVAVQPSSASSNGTMSLLLRNTPISFTQSSWAATPGFSALVTVSSDTIDPDYADI